MATNVKINNFAKTTLALGCTASDLTLNVADASVFPSITGAEYFFLVLENASLAREIVKCTGKAANTLAVVRAQEGTTARAWNQGDRVALRLTAGTLEARLAELKAAMDTRLGAVESSLSAVAGRIKIGEIVDWPTEAIPTGFLECNGAAVPRSGAGGYPELFAAIGTRYGAGDGVTTFNLPDRRGEFVRGWDHGAGRDPDAATRSNRGDGTTGSVVGTKQADQFKSHQHRIGYYRSTHALSGNEPQIDPWIGLGGNVIPLPPDSTVGGSETRSRNVSTVYIIRYA